MPHLLSTEDAANYLSVASNSLRRSRWSGILCSLGAPSFIKLGPKAVRYDKDVLDDWLADCSTYSSTAQARIAEGRS